MSTLGRYKYICADCGGETWLSRKDRQSRFRPRCIECGSISLDPCKKSEGKNQLPKIRDAYETKRDVLKRKMNMVKDE